MPRYLFIFGRTPELSLLELHALVPQAQSLCPGMAIIPQPYLPLSPARLQAALGGTVKIALIISETSMPSSNELAAYLAGNSAGSVTFTLSSLSPEISVSHDLFHEVKKALTARGIATRFVLPRDGRQVSSVVISKQQVTELLFVKDHDRTLVARTEAVQDVDDWTRQDRGRPYADPRAGMLPAKIARMIVNVARTIAAPSSSTLFDPFCGMGTILAQALMTGWRVVGSDQASDVVDKARANLRWLVQTYKFDETRFRLFTSEATHVHEHLVAPVSAIVTEPFMGSTRLGQEGARLGARQVANILKGLEKLYIGCFREWAAVLRPGGKLVIALPRIVFGARQQSVKKVVDICENLGYTALIGPIEYSRPQAVVRREFYVFQKN